MNSGDTDLGFSRDLSSGNHGFLLNFAFLREMCLRVTYASIYGTPNFADA